MTTTWRAVLLVAAVGRIGVLSLAGQTAIPAGTPLRVQIDHRYRVHTGTRIEGHLIAPVYRVDHKLLAVNTPVSGTMVGRHSAPKNDRVLAVINGQFIPPSIPEIEFDALHLPDGATVKMETTVVQRDATVVKMSINKKHSGLREQVREEIQNRKREALDTLHHPNVGDRIEKWIYAQLPWSPQTLWTGTQYDAELTAPLEIPGTPPAPLPRAEVQGTPTGIVEARLTSDLDSGTDQRGAPVTAVLTRPLLSADGTHMLFPEGAQLTGMVTVAQRARWFARSGRLRFTFRNIEAQEGAAATIHGQLAGAEAGAQENLKINEEGTAASSAGPGKYLAPMALGVLAASTYGDDAGHLGNSAVVSNGFGFAARVATMAAANPAVGRGFAYFALSKSLYFRWIARGHEIRFPKDTQIEILLNDR